MPDELVFYTHPMTRGRIVRWMLEEIGAPYRAETLDYHAMKSPEYLAVNPMGKVPAIRHRGAVVTEVAAICAYLADAFPEARLAPAPDDPERGSYYRWMFFTAGPFEAAVTDKWLGAAVPEDRRRSVGYGCYADVMATLEGVLDGRDYAAAGRFTAADVVLGSQLMFGTAFGMVEKRPAFASYMERLGARPAAIRAREIDDAIMQSGKG